MGDTTGIGWTNVTWNPFQGCTKVSPACTNCYMYREKRRYGQDPTIVVRSKDGTFNRPLAKKRGGAWVWPDGQLVFTCSWTDFLHEDADDWRAEAWAIIRQRPGLTFQILTKRTERLADCLPSDWGPDGYPNVHLGATVENQDYVHRIDELLAVPAALHFISAEPLLGPLEIGHFMHESNCPLGVSDPNAGSPVHDPAGGCSCLPAESGWRERTLAWVIAGGESGPRSRATEMAWFTNLRAQCQMAGVPYFQKQLGEVLAREFGSNTRTGHTLEDLPPNLRVQEHPV